MSDHSAPKWHEFRKLFPLIAAVMFVLWLVWWGAVSKWGGERAQQGQLGDLFGGINALFSGMALAGVVTAVILQSRELELQREELKLTRTELTKSAEANQKAAEALNKQIEMQLRAAELTTISTLLASVNSQLGKGTTLEGDPTSTLVAARKEYHIRLHEILQAMGRGITLPQTCRSIPPEGRPNQPDIAYG